MYDCENEVFDRVSAKVLEQFPDVDLASEYVRAPSSFPHVSIEMRDCSIYRTRQTLSGDHEDFTCPTFEVNVYSNKVNGKKSECKAIMEVIDKAFFSMNFNRTALTPVPNLEDASIYRLVARFRAITDGKGFYRR